MTSILAEVHLTPEGKEQRITLHGYGPSGRLEPTMFNDAYLIKEIPGRKWDHEVKRWSLPLNWGSCLVARAQFGDRLVIGLALDRWARAERIRRDRALHLRNLTAPDDTIVGAVSDHDEKLYPFQIPGRDFLVAAQRALLGDEMGSGKTIQTATALRIADILEDTLTGVGAYPALIVCPNTLKRNWEREIRQWLPEANPIVIQGNATKRRKQLDEAAETDRAVVIMNIEIMRLHSRLSAYGSEHLKRCTECDPKNGTEGLKAAACQVHPKELNAIPFRVCVLDEAHRAKDPKALQTRAIWNTFHGESVKYRWALTGTPIANHPGDLWSVLHMLDPKLFPGKTAYLDRYAIKYLNPFGGMDVLGLRPDRKEEFYALLDPMFRRMIKAEVLTQLPGKVYIRQDVEMSPKQAKAYNDIEGRMVTRLEDGTILVADGNLPAATRMLQFASAYCEVDTTTEKHDPDDPTTWSVLLKDPSPKVDALMEIIADNPGKPLAIAAEHKQLINLVDARLVKEGIKFGRVTGDESADERAAAVQAFQDGRLDYLLFTYAAGGVGINLTRADTLVRLQRSWSLVQMKQGEDRVHRIGSEIHESITIIDVVTAGTIEEAQIERLIRKGERLEEIVRDRAKLRALGKDVAELDAESARLEGTGLMED